MANAITIAISSTAGSTSGPSLRVSSGCGGASINTPLAQSILNTMFEVGSLEGHDVSQIIAGKQTAMMVTQRTRLGPGQQVAGLLHW